MSSSILGYYVKKIKIQTYIDKIRRKTANKIRLCS